MSRGLLQRGGVCALLLGAVSFLSDLVVVEMSYYNLFLYIWPFFLFREEMFLSSEAICNTTHSTSK